MPIVLSAGNVSVSKGNWAWPCAAFDQENPTLLSRHIKVQFQGMISVIKEIKAETACPVRVRRPGGQERSPLRR